ncbi:MAG: hypothetical protein AB7G23_16695 [Vicinamibacterales bacterium]|nr:hypothetical protein [Acidobacteriota bacterium]
MLELLTAIESSTFATWLRESGSIWAYPAVLTLHTFGLAVLVGANTVLDLRLLGAGQGIPLSSLSKLFPVMWVGFWVNALSGVALFCADATTKGTTNIFFLKLGFVLVGVVIIFMLKSTVYGRGPDAATTSSKASSLALASLLVWAAATTAGRLMAYITL